VLDSALERRRIVGLRQELERYREASLAVLASDRTQWAHQARLLLTRQIMPRRDTVLRILDEAQTLNRAAYVQQQRAIGEIYESTQRRIWQRLGFALAASLVIAVVATLYVGRLESAVRRQQRQAGQNSLDLQRLSAKLVKAQEEERRTIARELHDEVGQMLMAIKVELSVAQRASGTSSGTVRALDTARAITDTTLSTVRDLSRLLHPAVLDDLGLPAAIEWYLGGLSKRHDLRMETSFAGMDERLAPEIEGAFYRIVQEAMTNVIKHARATTCRVELRREDGNVMLTIQDDGIGFDRFQKHRDAEPPGLGLIGIRERTLQLGGRASVESELLRGTRVTAVIPVRPRADSVDQRDEAVVSTNTDAPAAPEWSRG
jgi:signal transduction histidine kinase